jgi:HK97 gp10 family phage protein
MAGTIGYVDITQLAADLTATAGGSFEANAKILVVSAINQIQTLAQAYAPVDSGALKGSISSYTRDGGMTGVVEASAKYASYVEFGTGVRGEFPGKVTIIRPRTPGGMLRWVGKDGKVHYAKQVRNPGMAPRPFLRPAMERVVPALAEGLAHQAVANIVHGPKAPETLTNAPATGWH